MNGNVRTNLQLYFVTDQIEPQTHCEDSNWIFILNSLKVSLWLQLKVHQLC